MTAALLVALCLILICWNGIEYRKRLDAEHRLATLKQTHADDQAYIAQVSEALLLWEARARRLNSERAEKVRLRVISGYPGSTNGGA